ncbi:Holliday junction branch migration DNA helicase RuvB [Sedimentisphaera salicampi]|uniref:Holliday junction branch migration complex subunit RuvB n=1 Tax=Sedimentisphaera salicampi TaxID=1941349 RepID=A0A1W6LP65_9BACT|nr:Holliday junction branch migration DNA helicase RuvB [Sedimentisphaera salicampi]ARN57536.1 Holliday junction ATP-dependent DNA helicase RuvB [Sedimentisphaera salicampi]OXU14398.1 Holliday junction ATP-dependent DNA helicase RuvB [Sedimentisphaera salicampi]
MAIERVLSAEEKNPAENSFNAALRPQSLSECIGQENVREKLRIAVEAASRRDEPLEHILFYGPPGLGKTTFANIIAREMNAAIRVTSGPALAKQGDIMGLLSNVNTGDIVFIDEIHRLNSAVEEFIYPAMEDFKVDFTVDSGLHAKTINFPLKRFTLIGATTRAGLLSSPLRSRFGMLYHLEYYKVDELAEIVNRSADMLGLKGSQEAIRLIAARSRRTPRIANRLLKRVRDYAQVKGSGELTTEIVNKSLEMERIDSAGLDQLDRSFLKSLITVYGGGPAGIEAIAATLGEERDTLEDVVEPYLLQEGFLRRTKRGREATPLAYSHLGISPQAPNNQPLFE